MQNTFVDPEIVQITRWTAVITVQLSDELEVGGGIDDGAPVMF